MKKSWHVYIISCSDDTLYTGITNDLARRIEEHNDGIGSKYTRPRRPVKLVYREKKRSRSAAARREAAIKNLTRQEKMELCSERLTTISPE